MSELDDVRFELGRNRDYLKGCSADKVQRLIVLALLDIRQLILEHSVPDEAKARENA